MTIVCAGATAARPVGVGLEPQLRPSSATTPPPLDDPPI